MLVGLRRVGRSIVPKFRDGGTQNSCLIWLMTTDGNLGVWAPRAACQGDTSPLVSEWPNAEQTEMYLVK